MTWRHERPKPSDVFVPTRIPLRDGNIYAKRAEPESALTRCLERGQVPVLYGEYGVGKTTVARRFFRSEDEEGRVVYVASASGKSLSDVFNQVLEQFGYTVETQVDRSIANNVDIGGTFVVTAKAASNETVATRFQVAVTSPTDAGLIDYLNHERAILIIDELHRASAEFRSQLSDFIKACRGHDNDYPAIVLIGTTTDAERLVKHDPGIDRFVKEVRVEPLTDDEATFIVVEGFRSLSLQIPETLVEKVVRTAAGAPTIVQSVCLDMAEETLRRGEEFVIAGDYETAIRTYLKEHGRRLAGTYLKVIEQVGPKKYRKQVLLAMAEIPHDYANMEEIRTGVGKQLSEDTPATALSGPLRELKTGADSILTDVQRHEGVRVHNLTSFRDPMMKSFIRFMREIEAQGLLPSSGDLT